MVNEKRSSGAGGLFAMGCGCVVLFFIVGMIGLGAYFVPVMIEGAQGMIADVEFAKKWQPPQSDLAPEELFPESIAGFERSEVGGNRIVGKMGVGSADAFAVYQSPDDEIEVFMLQVDESEKDTIFAAVSLALDNGDFSWKSRATVGDTMTFSVSSPPEIGKLWWSKGWMFYFYKTTSGDTDDFAEQFLTEIDSQ